MNVIERIESRILIADNGCHLFQGAIDRQGYGRVGLPGGRGAGTGYTHRLIHEAKNGKIPAGMHIDHLCRNRACCNPEHLEAVTQGENNRRAHVANKRESTGVRRTDQSVPNPWRAEIHINGRNVHLGLFPTYEAALAARKRAELTADPERREQIVAEVKALEASE